MPGIPPPVASWRIIFCASTKRSTRLLTSVTVEPEPRAMRCRREPLRILWSRRSCGVIDRMIAVTRSISLLVDVLDLLAHLPHARQHPEQLGHRAHLAHRLHLGQEVLEGEVLAAAELAGHLLGLALVERLLGLLDEGEHVAHAEDARGHPVGVEGVEVVDLLAVRREHHLPAGHLRDRQGRATAGVAVELGQHDAVEADAVEERLRRVDRVLADHRVDDEQDLVGVDRVADVGGLLHQLGIDAQPAGGVDDHDVVHLLVGVHDRAAGHVHRVADAVAGLRREHRHAGALADDLQLGHGVRPLEVGGDEHRLVALRLEPVGELAGQRRLSGALQAGEHDDRRRVLREPQPPGLAAEDLDELLVDDLDDLLRRVERLVHLDAARPLAHRLDEVLDHRQGDVGLEQCDPDLAGRGVDVGVGQLALAAQVLERGGEAVLQGGEHAVQPNRRRSRRTCVQPPGRPVPY